MTRQEWLDQHPDAHEMPARLRAMLMAVVVKYEKTDPVEPTERDFQILYDKLRTAGKTQEFYDVLEKVEERYEAKKAKKAKEVKDRSVAAEKDMSAEACIALCEQWLKENEPSKA